MTPKHIQLQIFIQANITGGKKKKQPANDNHIWLAAILFEVFYRVSHRY